jgi:hypothetical protein
MAEAPPPKPRPRAAAASGPAMSIDWVFDLIVLLLELLLS